MKSNERSIKFYDLKFTASAKPPGQLAIAMDPGPLADLLTEWKIFFSSKVIDRNWGRQHWSFSEFDVDIRAKKAVFLITRSDPQGADQALSNPKAKKFSVIAKGQGEGNAFSSHVMIKLQAGPHPNHYLVLVEDTPGITAPVLQKLLVYVMSLFAKSGSKILMRRAPSGATDAKGNPLQMKLRFKFELRGHPSDNFKSELNAGVLGGIEVIKYKKKNFVWDDAKTAIEKSEVVHLTSAPANSGTLYGMLRSVCKTAVNKSYETVRIKFKDENNYNRTVAVDPADLSILNEDRYIKKVRLEGFTTKLDTGYDKLHTELVGKMSYLLK